MLLLTYSTDLSTREAASLSATQEIRNSLWDPMINYRVHKSPQLVPSYYFIHYLFHKN
jgi:hypothetical protein